MNREDFKFAIINTRSLWSLGTADGIRFTDEGISLREITSYTFSETFTTGASSPAAIALDGCGALHVLDAGSGRVLMLAPDRSSSEWIECISFENPQSVAVSDSDIFVLHDKRLTCIARVNRQTKWERETDEDIAIAATDNNHLYVLSRSEGAVFRTDRDWKLVQISLTDEQGMPYAFHVATDIASDEFCNIYILDASKGIAVKFNSAGEFIEKIPILFRPGMFPITLAADVKGRVFAGYRDSGELLLISRTSVCDTRGSYITRAFDCNIPECRWHKVVLDADIPDNTAIRLYYYVSGDSELPAEPAWSGPILNPEDSLITDAKGRYLWLRIEMFRDVTARNGPLIRSLRAYFPRLTYLRYLPATYQEDAASRDFLERFLSIFETVFGSIESETEAVTSLFDIKAAPREFLPWLSAWLAQAFDGNWREERWREFLSKAVELYKQRGTRKSIDEMIRIFTGDSSVIVEPFQLRCPDGRLNQDFSKLFGSDPYTFCVLLKPGQVSTETEANTVKRIIDCEKPAHTAGGLQMLQPLIVLGAHTYLGINTFFSKPAFVTGRAVLPMDTVLDDSERGGQVQRHSIVGRDTLLT